MGKVIQFPELDLYPISVESPITKKTALDEIEQLSWEDPKTFFALMENCLSCWPAETAKNYPITRTQAWRIVHEATTAVGVIEHISCHSLRKALGYHA